MKQPKSHAVCGATNRQGEPCQKPPLKGRTRCRLHGGATPKGGAGRPSHGIYRKTLSNEEQALWETLQLGNLDNEIFMMRIMLNRAIEINADIRQDPNSAKNLAGFELTEITRQTGNDSGGKGKTNFTSKRPDTVGMIDRFAGRIAMLEKTRAELIAAAATNADDPNAKASDVVTAIRAMIRTEADIDPDAAE